jgi:opacity protein-like surface antigen
MKRFLTAAALAALTIALAAPADAQSKKKKATPAAATDCKAVISTTGSQRITQNGARSSVQAAWRTEVRAQHGEQYQELQYARDVSYRCSRATAGLTRCSISAQPCRVPTQPAAGAKK